MPAEFLANDFESIARSMRRTAPPTPAVLHFWDTRNLLTSAHDSVEAAVAEAYAFETNAIRVPIRITTPNGKIIMDTKDLAEAMLRYGDGMPV